MVKPTIQLRRDGDTWSLTTLSEQRNEEITFGLGKQASSPFYGDDKATSVFTEDGNKLVQNFSTGGKQAKVVWVQFAEGLIVTHSAEGVTAVRKHKVR